MGRSHLACLCRRLHGGGAVALGKQGGSAPESVLLEQDDFKIRSLLFRDHGGHKSGYSGTDDDNVRFLFGIRFGNDADSVGIVIAVAVLGFQRLINRCICRKRSHAEAAEDTCGGHGCRTGCGTLQKVSAGNVLAHYFVPPVSI